MSSRAADADGGRPLRRDAERNRERVLAAAVTTPCLTPAMTERRLRTAGVIAVLDTVFLIAVGATMWSDAPSAAEEAVGKGLVTLGVALAVPSVVFLFRALERVVNRPAPITDPGRSDWDPV